MADVTVKRLDEFEAVFGGGLRRVRAGLGLTSFGVQVIELPPSFSGYPQHDHLYCQMCDKLIEFSSEELANIRDAVAAEHDFRVTGHRLIISGVCHDCSRTRHRRQSPLDLI